MRVDDFDFELPPDRIALRPADNREAARLLVIKDNQSPMEDRHIADLPDYLEAGDVIVVNDTRVIPARLQGYRVREAIRAHIDVTLHKRVDAYQWWAFIRPAKKVHLDERIHFFTADKKSLDFSARLRAKSDSGEVLLEFSCGGADLDHSLALYGAMPLPPYIAARRPEDDQDKKDYQTIFAKNSGAVAAPTAGLHFTPALLDKLEKKGIDKVNVTLHVGAGTFLPVKVDDVREHKMHAEWGDISAEAATRLNAARQAGKRIIAIGTTSLRLLESAVDDKGYFSRWQGDTSIFITPGYRFKAVDVLFTNFHLPRSTLLMLVSAFSGRERILQAYRHAIEQGYRFYSYGDACLLFKASTEL